MATPAEHTSPHACENDCGRDYDVILVDIRESTVNLLCSPCHLGMMMAVVREVIADQDGQAVDTAPAPA